MEFLSERNVELHREYLNNLILKYRIFEKSYPELVGVRLDGIHKAKIPYYEREEAEKLLSEIEVHKIFFSSFGKRNLRSERIKREFGSESQFLYQLLTECRKADTGFLLIYEDNGKISFYTGSEYGKILKHKRVKLALDLCEHAYFYDYGFNRDSYISAAISFFDFDNIEKSDNRC